MRQLKETGLTKEELIHAFKHVLRGRRLDERLWQLTRIGKTSFNISGQGAEVGQVAMVMAFQPEKDYFLPYYRDMTACLAWGMSSKDMILGSFGKEADPSSHGRQMPNHYGSKEHNIISHSSPVSTQLNVATGIGYAALLEESDSVTVATTGEGSFNQGEVAEAMNFAAIKKLPIIFVVENNLWAISVGIEEQYANKEMADRAAAYGFEGIRVDGMDFAECYLAFKRFVDEARAGNGPGLVELMVSRMTSHSSDDDQTVYRSKEELEEMKTKDPLAAFQKQMLDEGYLTQQDIDAMELELKEEINQATDEAEHMPDPDAADILAHVWAEK
ncbi:thiamine pyrophosphate-dependent dehydrogenase E1 component subunit alpha [Macrococcus brunensis]|uniref:thiamine pyrophosphate-dependent dehydrogenase E1 component subunit alpha n=1 Tax=Macrococcus brunensis TaxID=198483 RepID=UPI001EF0A365|nr:thiamine pyrophosphate-dependent dehydrogenase E1 component subunit alpha [Macrococcus brunensis]ULG74266.1 thiamine pyrophosphate-dependent dehydrogenase E1 component subunit alpha [Macrococcus brunensis]